MSTDAAECPCQAAGAQPAETLDALRAECVVLRELLLPDRAWEALRSMEEAELDAAAHRSIVVLAHERGHLAALTRPLHKYLVSAGQLRPSVSAQYRSDLSETWLAKEGALERHRGARIYMGRIAEMLAAEWFEVEGSAVHGLEALGAPNDIQGTMADGSSFAVEVKFFGEKDDLFLSDVESLAGRGGVVWLDPYAAANYVLFRAYEASEQLADARGGARIACLVIDAVAELPFRVPLADDWIKWAAPRLYERAANSEWSAFLARLKERVSDIEARIVRGVSSLDAVVVLKMERGFSLTPIKRWSKVAPNGTA